MVAWRGAEPRPAGPESPKDGGDLCVDLAELPIELKHCRVRRAISEGPLVERSLGETWRSPRSANMAALSVIP
jgi:hypothetical protein